MKYKSKVKIAKMLIFKNKIVFVLTIGLLAILTGMLSICFIAFDLDEDRIYANATVDNGLNLVPIVHYDQKSDYILSYSRSDLEELTSYLDSKSISYEIPQYLVTSFLDLIPPFSEYSKYVSDLEEFNKQDNYFDGNVIQKKSQLHLSTQVYSDPRFYQINKDNFEKMDYIGKYPDGANEVAISNFVAEILMYYGYYNQNTDEEVKLPNTLQGIVDEQVILTFGDVDLKIVGIYFLEDFDYQDVIDFEFLYEVIVEDDEYVWAEAVSDYPRFDKLTYEMRKYYVSEDFFEQSDLPMEYNLGHFSDYRSYFLVDDTYHILQNPTADITINKGEIVISFDTLNDITNGEFESYVREYIDADYWIYDNQEEVYELANRFMIEKEIYGQELLVIISDSAGIVFEDGDREYYFTITGVRDAVTNYISEDILRPYLSQTVRTQMVVVLSDDVDTIYSLLTEFKQGDKSSKYWASVGLDDDNDLFGTIEKTAKTGLGLLIGMILSAYIFVLGMIFFINRKNFRILRELGIRKSESRAISLIVCGVLNLFIALLSFVVVYGFGLVINNLISEELLKVYTVINYEIHFVVLAILVSGWLSVIGTIISYSIVNSLKFGKKKREA